MAIIGIVGLVVTLVALVLGLCQIKMANRQTVELAAILDSLSTRSLGQFPDFNLDIARLLKRANTSIDILCDVPAYGHISNEHAWFGIAEAIRKKIHGDFDVSIIVYDPTKRAEVINEQARHRNILHNNPGLRSKTPVCSRVPDDDRPDASYPTRSFQTNPSTIRALQRILDKRNDSRSPENLSRNERIEISLREHQIVLSEVFKGARVDEISEHIPIYFWMIDRREAIISIPIFSGESTEHGFVTKDGSLISALLQMRDRYRKKQPM